MRDPGGASPAALLSPDEARIWWWGRALLGVALLAGLAVVFALAARGPVWSPLVPAAVIAGGLVLGALGRTPYGHLCGVMALFALSIGYDDGIQPLEVAFALYYAAFISHWFVTRIFVYRERVVRNLGDAALVFFLCYMSGSLVLTFLFRGSMATAFSDWVNFSYFAIYFPVREACERDRRGPWIVAAILVGLAIYAAVQNIFTLNHAFSDATHAWQVARGRVPMNEMPLLVGALISLTTAQVVRPVAARVAFALLFGVLTGALIIAQSRAYYVDLILGLAVLIALSGRGHRLRLAAYGAVGIGCLVALALVFFAEYTNLIAVGLLDRALSIGTATSSDISLLNRFIETRAAWELILINPIVGYGIGTDFGFFDAVSDSTWVKAYVHNGYVLLWFKFGIIGLSAVLIVWIAAIVRGLRPHAAVPERGGRRLLAIVTGVALIAIIPSHFAAATFTTGDTTMTFAILCGLANGLGRGPRTGRLFPADQTNGGSAVLDSA